MEAKRRPFSVSYSGAAKIAKLGLNTGKKRVEEPKIGPHSYPRSVVLGLVDLISPLHVHRRERPNKVRRRSSASS